MMERGRGNLGRNVFSSILYQDCIDILSRLHQYCIKHLYCIKFAAKLYWVHSILYCVCFVIVPRWHSDRITAKSRGECKSRRYALYCYCIATESLQMRYKMRPCITACVWTLRNRHRIFIFITNIMYWFICTVMFYTSELHTRRHFSCHSILLFVYQELILLFF